MASNCSTQLAITLVLAIGFVLAPAPDTTVAANDQSSPFAAAIEYAQQRTVKIYGASIGRVSGFATGLIVSAEGDIITSQGVHLSGFRVRVTLPDGTMHNAKVVRRDADAQLALLKVEVPTPAYFALSESQVGKSGDWVLAVSNAFKVADGVEPLSVNLGVASLRTELDAKRQTQDYDYHGDVLLIDAITSNPGAAGGAVVTVDKQLAGMIGKVIEGKSTNTRLNYAVPNDVLHAFFTGKDLGNQTVPVAKGKAVLGIRLFALGGRNSPAYIDRVSPSSPASKVKLQPDDLIVSIDGQQVRTVRDYGKILESLVPGQPVTLIVKRRNSLVEVKITPDAEEE
jgi:serine protease Do